MKIKFEVLLILCTLSLLTHSFHRVSLLESSSIGSIFSSSCRSILSHYNTKLKLHQHYHHADAAIDRSQAQTTTSRPNVPPSEIVYRLYKQASYKDSTDDSSEAILIHDHGNIARDIALISSGLSDIEIIRLLWALGSLGIRATGLEEYSAWQGLEERISKIDFKRNLFIEMTSHDEYLVSRGFNRGPAIISPSPLRELLLGIYKMDISWGKLTRATRYALCNALYDEIRHKKHIQQTSKISFELKGRMPSMATASSSDVQQYTVINTKPTKSRTLLPLISLLGHIKASYSEFPTELREEFEDSLVAALNSPPPFFSLANTLLSLARMKFDVSLTENPLMKKTISACIMKNIHTVHRSVYWKLLVGLSSLNFKWPSLDLNTRKAIEYPLSFYSDDMKSKPTSKEIARVLNSMRNLRVDWDVLSTESQKGVLHAIDGCLPSMSPHEVSILLSSFGAMSMTFDQFPGHIQEQLIGAIDTCAPLMRSWDLAQLVLGLGMLEAPSSFLCPGSILESLILQNQRKFGPIIIPSLVQGVALIRREKQVSSELQEVLFMVVGKFSNKMSAMSLFETLYALSLICRCEMSALPLQIPYSGSSSDHHLEAFLFQKDTDPQDLSNTLLELKILLPTVQPVNVPNTIFFCHKVGCDVQDLLAAQIWYELLAAVETSADRWSQKHEKVSMLLNAIEKLGARSRDIPYSTQAVLLNVVQREIPNMGPRLVSNVLYYLARLKLNQKQVTSANFRRVLVNAFFPSCHLMESSEFSNGLWAIVTLLDLHMASPDYNEEALIRGVCAQSDNMNTRDLSTLMTSLGRIGYDREKLPSVVLDSILDTITRVEMDSTSVALLLFTLGGMKFDFADLPSFVRVAMREAMLLHIRDYSARELFWVVIGCSRMKFAWENFDDEFKEGLSHSLAVNLQDPSLKRPSLLYMIKAMAKMSVIWEELSIEARSTIECCVRVMLREKKTDDCTVADLLTNLSKMKIDATSPLSMRTKNAFFTRISRINVNQIDPLKLVQILQALRALQLDITSLPKGVVMHIRQNFFKAFHGRAGFKSYVIIAFWRALCDLKIFWKDMSDSERRCIASESILAIGGEKSSPSLLISCLQELRFLGANYEEIIEYNSSFASELIMTVDKLISKPQNSKLLRTSYERRSEDLVRELSLFAAKGKLGGGGVRGDQQRQRGDNDGGGNHQIINPFRKLNNDMANLSDQEVVRAIFMLGQRVPSKRVPARELISSGTLDILDNRLLTIFTDSLSDLQCKIAVSSAISLSQPRGVTSGSDSCSSAALIAVLVSMGRIGVKAKQINVSLEVMLSYFTMISGNIDRRAFIAIVRSFISLGITWEYFSPSHREGLASGIARAASTAPPSRIPSLFKSLVELQVPCSFLHETIPLVLRYILFRTFTSVVTYDRTGSGSKVSRRAYLETIEYLAAMQASHTHIGTKASVAMLVAAERSLLADPSLCNRYIRAIGIICDDAPPEFWRGLPVDAKQSLKSVFETAVFGMLNIKPNSFRRNTSAEVYEEVEEDEEGILVIDFKDTDRFLPFLTYMDMDVDVFNSIEDEEKSGFDSSSLHESRKVEDVDQAMYNQLIEEEERNGEI